MSMSCIITDSVISRISVEGSSPVSARIWRTSSTISGRATWRADRLTAMWSGGIGRVAQSAARPRSAHASSSTHRPIGTISPVSSASGMKSRGGTMPRSGWNQRIKRLHAGDPSRLQLDHRLVEQKDRFAIQLCARRLVRKGGFPCHIATRLIMCCSSSR